MKERNRIGELEIRELFCEVYDDLAFPDEKKEEIWEAFLDWYENDLKDRWWKKIRHFLLRGNKKRKEHRR